MFARLMLLVLLALALPARAQELPAAYGDNNVPLPACNAAQTQVVRIAYQEAYDLLTVLEAQSRTAVGLPAERAAELFKRYLDEIAPRFPSCTGSWLFQIGLDQVFAGYLVRASLGLPEPNPTAAPELTPAPVESMTFSSEERGLTAVFGPFTILPGAYRFRARTDGSFGATIEVLSGECSYTDIVAFEGEASNGAEALLRSEGCEAVLEVAIADQPWTAELTPLE